jgi:hypothetical protein
MAKTKLEKTNDIGFGEFAIRVFAIARGSLKNPNNDRGRGYYTTWETVKDAADINRQTRLEGSEVHVGGISGGSCWDTGEGGDPHYAYTEAHDDPTIECLDDILAKFCPEITFLQYKRLVKEAELTSEESGTNDYYGNSSNYVRKVCTPYNLYLALVTVGVIGEAEPK